MSLSMQQSVIGNTIVMVVESTHYVLCIKHFFLEIKLVIKQLFSNAEHFYQLSQFTF